MHSQQYKDISQKERLNCLDTTAGSIAHINGSLKERTIRPSPILQDEIEQTIKQMIDYPSLGGQKGSLKLQSEEKALLGATSYQKIKQSVKVLSEEKCHSRKEQSELNKNRYVRKKDKEGDFKKVEAAKVEIDDVWAIDFVNLKLFGALFSICVVYELCSQSYFSIIPAINATNEIAIKAIDAACKFRGTKPKECLLSDGGSQFTCFSFESLLEELEIHKNQIPKGQPWYNGALESGNRDLKSIIKTIALYEACNETSISKKGVSREKILEFLNRCCIKAQFEINEKIVRPKFKSTPMDVLKGKVGENELRLSAYKKVKQEQRKQSMEELKQKEDTEKKSLKDNIKSAWNKIARTMSPEKLFAFTELINGRYNAVTV